MGFTKTIAPALLCVMAAITTGTATAAPAPEQPALKVEGTDHAIAYQVALTEDKRAAVSTLQAGRFLATWDGEAVLVTDDAGLEVATLPLKYEVAGKTLDLAPAIEDGGRRLTLTPANQSETPLRDINAQQQFFDVVQANLPGVLTGAAIGGAIGFVLGFPAGLFVLDFITIPITTTVGAIIGAFVGLQQSGGQPAVDAALTYAESLVPGAANAIRPAFEALPEPQPR
ncbi:hypothetical protein [Nocardia sp. NPDC127526]|uniref:hypothetical protein n=1 Tax=Nocardia sp. NPDC127526 TaxID=3345393 RepID=UPI0036342DA7